MKPLSDVVKYHTRKLRKVEALCDKAQGGQVTSNSKNYILKLFYTYIPIEGYKQQYAGVWGHVLTDRKGVVGR